MTASARPVRTRIAPSPTGDPHIGTAYMSLFDFVAAKQSGGQFVVRIEDTDQKRYRAESEAQILASLKWLGIQWDEGPDVGGPFGPYRQSERLDIYKKYAQILIEKGDAYYCFCSEERLEQVRKEQHAQKLSTVGYDRHCRDLPKAEVEQLLAAGAPFVIRMKMPLAGKTTFEDKLRGTISFDNETVDDQVLWKSDGFPTYHFAVVVDDHLMQITQVIRGEEWISSTPKHVVLYEMFGWEKPEFVHLPLLRNIDRSKISKRKNPTSIMYYRRKGILPDCLLNFLALMGWNPGNDREIFSLEDMIHDFSWERFSLGGPVFDLTKLSWMNGLYLRQLSDERWLSHLRNEVFPDDYLRRIIPLVKERIEKFEDFVKVTDYFFAGDLSYELELLLPKNKTAVEIAGLLSELAIALDVMDDWGHDPIERALKGFLAERGLKPKDLYMSIRVALTGRKESPGLYETMDVLGKEMSRRRLRLAAEFLQNVQPV